MPELPNLDAVHTAAGNDGLMKAEDAVRLGAPHVAPNGLRYLTFGALDLPHTSAAELARLAGSVPAVLTDALQRYTYAFVPMALSAARLKADDAAEQAISPDDPTLIAPRFDPALADKANCHRNSSIGDREYVFLSSRLHNDRFALAFELAINVAHNFTDSVGGTPESFAALAWAQATAGVRGETSLDAWEHRADALGQPATNAPARSRRSPGTSPAALPASAPASASGHAAVDEKARSAYLETAFSDAIAIYLLSLYLDFDYADLRERDYPLLSPPALADRLRAVHQLFPPNPGYEFAIRYRRK